MNIDVMLSHPKIKPWIWFIILWTLSLCCTLAIAYILKWILKLFM